MLVAGAAKSQGTLHSAGRTLRGLLASPWLVLLCRVALGAVFLYAGATKVLGPGSLASSIRSYELGLPEWFVTVSARGLPPLEIMLGLYLVVGLFTRVSAWATNALMLVFTLALVQGALRGLQIDCGCFGANSPSNETPNLWLDVLRDLGLLALGLVAAFGAPGKLALDSLLHRGR